jgi:DNA-binding transcriptional ArsR family regulator
MADAPRKIVITDPQVLRALAHPLRLRLIEELVIAVTATATELAERVGESPANCSWHLRQLAKYGYIEEAPGGTGRQRPWRIVPVSRSWGGPDADPALVRAGDAATTTLMDYEYQALRDYQARRAGESPEWRDAAGSVQSVAWLTADELREVQDKVFELHTAHFDRLTDAAVRPPGARMVRLVGWGIPVRGPEDGSTSTPVSATSTPASATSTPASATSIPVSAKEDPGA